MLSLASDIVIAIYSPVSPELHIHSVKFRNITEKGLKIGIQYIQICYHRK
jgi:hypothetical protein